MNAQATVRDPKTAEVARSIQELDRVAGLELAHEVGQLMLDHLFDGDPERLRDRDARDPALRRLAGHAELCLDVAGLQRVLTLYETIEALGGVGACRHVSAAHVRATLALPASGRVEILRLAEEHRWSPAEVERAAQAMACGWIPPRCQAAAPEAVAAA